MELIKYIGYRKTKNGSSGASYGLFLCPYCNNHKEKQLGHGRRYKSCGCVSTALGAKSRSTHNESRTSLYKTWTNMRDRCYNPKCSSYNNWGGRGIAICDEWKNDYVRFASWSKNNGYKKGLFIDRIDNDKGYSPANCRFVTSTVSGRNNRNVKLSFDSARIIRGLHFSSQHKAKSLSVMFGVNRRTINDIINNITWTDKEYQRAIS